MKLKKIYDKSPIFIQNIFVSMKGWANSRRRYGKHYHEHLLFLSEFEGLSLEDKLEYQRGELVKLVNHAYENSEFYREFYHDVDISSIKNVDDLKRLPILTKELLRENIDRIVIKKAPCSTSHTGGTTGKSLTIWRTDNDLMERMATLDYFKSKVGFIHRKMKRASFNGKPIVPQNQKKKIFWRYNSSCKQKIFSSFHITEENMKYYVDELNRFKPQAIDGFFSSMCDIAGYIQRNRIELEFTPIAIFPTSETLTDEGRALLEQVFGCKVYNQYASSEGAPFVCECESQTLHMDLSSGVFEKVDDKRNPFDDEIGASGEDCAGINGESVKYNSENIKSDLSLGEMVDSCKLEHDGDPDASGCYEVLVTSFTSYATPLIRYRIGDRMTFADASCGSNDVNSCKKTCLCGDNSPVVIAIEGRKQDFLYNAEGAKINAGNVSNILKYIPNAIIHSQFIQTEKSSVTLLLETDKELYKPQYDKAIRDEFLQKFGENTKLVIEHTDYIPREKSGKFRMIKNHIDE